MPDSRICLRNKFSDKKQSVYAGKLNSASSVKSLIQSEPPPPAAEDLPIVPSEVELSSGESSSPNKTLKSVR